MMLIIGPVLRIRIGINGDPNPGPGSQTNADPDLGQTLPSQKFGFDVKNILYVSNMS